MRVERTQIISHITTAGTTRVFDGGCSLAYVIISVVAPGSNWNLTIQDANGNILIPPPDLTPQAGVIIRDWMPAIPPRMAGGIDIVSAGTPGDIWYWLWLDYSPAG
jgi:hypothetical protein